MKIRYILVAALAAATLTPGVASANPGDPPITITCDATSVAVGDTLHCTITDTGGYLPNNVVKYRNPRTGATINVAQLGYTFTPSHTPTLGEAGRTEILMVTIYLPSTGHLVRAVSNAFYFTVTP